MKCAEIDKAIGGARSTEAWRVVKQLKTENNDRINKGITVDSWRAQYESLLVEDRVEFAEQIKDNDERDEGLYILVEKCLKSMKNGRSLALETLRQSLLTMEVQFFSKE
ncbi:hypothetical protein HHI36_012778 [Cryptolaemus montrouzieri]|uniref:Uncharacterized protein n=1 Tax=Cryptolaemus montrouzieri TaxID=559131 RepID=A0ABD2NGA3_9CUCU